MKIQNHLIRIPPAFLFAAGLGLCFSSAYGADQPATKAECCVKQTVATGPISDSSLYQLESTWTDDANVAMKLAALRGRPQVVTMFFAKCVSACPVLLRDMRKIEAALPPEIRERVGFVLVSFDTERDTPEALAEYRRTQKLPDNWILLRGKPEDVLELAALLGVRFKKDARGDFAHSNVISLLNKNGEIVTQQLGLSRDPIPISANAQKLIKAAD